MHRVGAKRWVVRLEALRGVSLPSQPSVFISFLLSVQNSKSITPYLSVAACFILLWVCSPGKRFASADRKGEIRLWDPSKGVQQGQPLSAHKQWVTSLTWEPLHRNSAGERLASSSKDALIKVNDLTRDRVSVERNDVWGVFRLRDLTVGLNSSHLRAYASSDET